ncbi:UMTA methyltransferase [Colletotrichum melonis]|uniref:UMTA methyltransferase n=1 Tax=Colletotrichum melonis TaxID=1209925 RepID=A0AAI9UY64_9PEZI|nr:UMTA methyltransferase [Colletotrichum melonis]
MPRTNKEKPVTAQAPSTTSPRLTTSSINADPILGYKIRVLIHDLSEKQKTPKRNDESTQRPREATIDVELQISTSAATQDNHEADENEERDSRVRISGLTVEEAIETVMNGFLDKRRASGDARPCGPHDLAPIYAALFGIHLLELQSQQFRQGRSTHKDVIGLNAAKDNSAQPLEAKRQIAGHRLAPDFGSLQDYDRSGEYTGMAVQMSANGGGSSDRSDAASLMSIVSDTSDEVVELEIGNSDMMIRPEAESQQIIGNDLSPVRPRLVPSNVRFEIDDVESDWLYEEQFDFIFSRYMAGSLSDWPTLVRRVYENLRPGGWVEFQGYDFEFSSLNRSLPPDHKTHQWDQEFLKAARLCGIEPCPGSKLELWVQDAGSTNIGHKTITVPLRPWAKDEYHQEIGLGNLIQL